MNDPRIKLIRPCEWEEVFLEWYKNEGTNPAWQELARERGFVSWAEWRLKEYVERFACREADWSLYEISDPADVVGGWYGGPFTNWIKHYYGGEKTAAFAEIVKGQNAVENRAIRRAVEDYPSHSMIVALELPDGRIFVIEGTHRASALAMMRKEGKPTPEKLLFAIGKSKLSELPPSGRAES